MTRAERIHFRHQITEAIQEVVDKAMYDGLYPHYDDTVMELLAIAYDHMRHLTRPCPLDTHQDPISPASAA